MTIKVEINMNNFPIKDRVTVYEARTRLGGCRTGVRRGPMRGAASDVAAHSSMPRLSSFFFFFLTYSCQLSSIRVDSALIHADLARIRPYWPNRVVSAGDRNRPK